MSNESSHCVSYNRIFAAPTALAFELDVPDIQQQFTENQATVGESSPRLAAQAKHGWGKSMKQQMLSLTVCSLLVCLGIGCDLSADHSMLPADVQDVEESTSEINTLNDHFQDGESFDGHEYSQGGESFDGEVEPLARNCTVTCNAVNISTEEACVPFTGFGSTSFLGGCRKACRRARQNAEGSAAAAGCRLTACTENCR